MQTSTISYVLRNSVRLGGSREKRERIGIVFCFSHQHTATTRVLGNSSVILIVVGMFLVKQQIIEQMMKLEIIYFIHLDIQMFLVIYLNQVEYLMISN